MKNIKVAWNNEKQIYEVSADVEIKQDENGNYYIEDVNACDFETNITIDDIKGDKGDSFIDNIESIYRKELISNTIIYYDLCEKYTKELIDRVLSETDIELKDIEQHLYKTPYEWIFLNDNPKVLGEFASCDNFEYNSIPQLKSKIKHSKNHMERIRLEKELNKLYVQRRLRKTNNL